MYMMNVYGMDCCLMPGFSWNGCIDPQMFCMEDGSARHAQEGALQGCKDLSCKYYEIAALAVC